MGIDVHTHKHTYNTHINTHHTHKHTHVYTTKCTQIHTYHTHINAYISQTCTRTIHAYVHTIHVQVYTHHTHRHKQEISFIGKNETGKKSWGGGQWQVFSGTIRVLAVLRGLCPTKL